jgi:hypothetical protein
MCKAMKFASEGLVNWLGFGGPCCLHLQGELEEEEEEEMDAVNCSLP